MGLIKTLRCIKKCFDIEPITLWIIGFVVLFLGVFICIYSTQLGAIIFAFAIAFFAGAISRKSEKMTRDIAFSSFYDSLNTMRERRLSLRDKLHNIEFKIGQKPNYTITPQGKVDVEDYIRYLSYTIWLSNIYLDRAMLFKKYISEKEREFLIGFIDNLFIDLCQGKWKADIPIHNKLLGQLESMYNIISNFIEFKKEDIGTQLKRERILDNLKFLKGLINYITDFDKCIIV